MARRGRIVAAVGPCIAQASYEVDEAFRDRFLAQAAENHAFFGEGAPGHWQFDLEAYVVHRLRSAGIETVEALGLDTYADPDRFYSFRRSTHRGEPAYGRQISLIEADGWQAAMAELGADIEWWQRRANLLVSGLRLPRREGAKIRVGSSLVIEVTMECDPCNRMEAIRPGLKAALMPDWRGGVLGRVLEDGDIAVGDDIRIEE